MYISSSFLVEHQSLCNSKIKPLTSFFSLSVNNKVKDVWVVVPLSLLNVVDEINSHHPILFSAQFFEEVCNTKMNMCAKCGGGNTLHCKVVGGYRPPSHSSHSI